MKLNSDYSKCYTYQLLGLGKLGHRVLDVYDGEGTIEDSQKLN
jgi:hypothetical protein